MVRSGDEYDAYDLSEFSATDFAHIDFLARRERNNSAAVPEIVTGVAQGRIDTNGSGGPQIPVVLEPAANESVAVKAATGRSRTRDVICAAEDAGKSEATDPHHTHKHKLHTVSPYERHRSSGILSVSDLVGPAWHVLNSDHHWSWITHNPILGVKFNLTMDFVKDGHSPFPTDLMPSSLPKVKLSQ
jgi:exonuclease V